MYQTWGYGSCLHHEQIKMYAKQYNESLIGIVSDDMEYLFSIEINNKNVLLNYFSSETFYIIIKRKINIGRN